MREILFRGKRVDNGEWVEGYCAAEPYTKNTYNHGYILENEKDLFAKKAWLVDSRTVGQFTGLTDKNGKEIFEGDILKGKFKNYAVWFDDDEKAYVYGSSFQGGYRHSVASYLSGDFKRLEVIGNIHDNPELLEVEK